MTGDLVSRLSETLDELERVAQFGGTAPWRRYLEGADDGWAIESTDAEVSFIVGDEDVAAHIARWDPKAVLGLVAAVRDVIQTYVAAQRAAVSMPNDHIATMVGGHIAATYGRAVERLAIGFGITEEGPSD